MRLASFLVFLFFVFAVVVQWNDPDSLRWMIAYAIAAGFALAAVFGRYSFWPTALAFALYAIAGYLALPPSSSQGAFSLTSFGMSSLREEEVREGLGLFVCALWMVVLLLAMRARRRPLIVFGGLLLSMHAGCAAHATAPASTAGHAIEIPRDPARVTVQRSRVAGGLENPRGMLPRPEGGMLVSLAGTGDPASPATSRLVLLEDRNGDGKLDGPGEERVLLDGQRSVNILEIIRRDEVFGLAGIERGNGETLVSLGLFGGPSTIYRVDGTQVSPWSRVHGNINDMTYDPARGTWMAVSSSSDEVVELEQGRGARRVVKLPPLSGGQDPVPGYLRHDPSSGELLITLFSGSTEGEEGGEGTELVARAGGIVALDPDTGATRWVITGLTAPTDLEIGPDGRIYVLEFCDAFEDPIESREDLFRGPSHGGFRRFSGRLLRIDRQTGQVDVLGEGLDAPTNLALEGQELFIAQGMGTPGRPIPGPDGTVPLEGFIEKIILPAPAVAKAASDA